MLKYQIIFLLNIFLIVGCSSNKKLIPSISGYYKMEVYKSSSKNKAFIFGHIYEYKSNLPIPFSAVKVDNVWINKANVSGKYAFSIQPRTCFLRSLAMQYKFTDVENLKINPGDSIKIDFYLKQDGTPLVD